MNQKIRIDKIHEVIGTSQIAITSRDREFLESVYCLNVLSPDQETRLQLIERKVVKFDIAGKPL